MSNRITVKDIYGRILGHIETSSNGDKRVLDRNYKIKGYYRKRSDMTTDFYGRTIAKGDHSSMLLKL